MYLLSLLGVLLFKFSLSWGEQKWKVQTSNSPKQEEHFWLAERKFQNKNGQMSDLDFSQENIFFVIFWALARFLSPVSIFGNFFGENIRKSIILLSR